MQSRMKRFVALTVLLILQVPTLVGCEGTTGGANAKQAPIESTLARIRREKVLRVGYIVYPPAVIRDPDTKELSGQFVEIAKYIASELSIRLEFQEATWSTFAAGLQSGQFDLSIAPTFAKVGRAASVHFSRPIAYLGNSAVVLRDNVAMASVRDVGAFDRTGLRVAVVQGEAAHEYATAHLTKAKLVVLSGSDLTAPCVAVSSGQADVGLTDAYVTTRCVAQSPKLLDLFASSPYDISPMAWAVRENDLAFLTFINNALDYVEASGRLRAWERQYGAHWLHRSAAWEAW